jgi:ABC-type proline/glycine betaine transport system permease subunit
MDIAINIISLVIICICLGILLACERNAHHIIVPYLSTLLWCVPLFFVHHKVMLLTSDSIEGYLAI